MVWSQNLRVPSTGALAAVIAEKDEILRRLGLGAVVRGAVPVLARCGRLGLGCRGRRGGGSGRGIDVSGGLGRSRRGGRGGGSRCRGRGGRGLAAEPVVLPGDDLAVNGGRDPVGAPLLPLLLPGRVDAVVAVGGLGLLGRRCRLVALPLALARWGVDGEFLEVEGAAKVKRKLRVAVSDLLYFVVISMPGCPRDGKAPLHRRQISWR